MEKTIIEGSPQFNTDTIKNLKGVIPVYHSDEDILFIRPKNSSPAVSYDLEGELWLRFDPSTKEVLGIEIENFQSVFLKKHPEIAKIWKDAKPFCINKKTRTADEDICESFIRILLSLFDDLFVKNPQQISFGLV